MTAALACLAFPVLAAAQGGELKLPSFTHLQQQATEVVDVSIGSWPLAIAARLIRDDDPDSAQTKTLLKGLKAVVVRSYQFDADFVYSKSDIAAVRAQLRGPGWTQLAQVRDRKENKDVDVYVALDHDNVTGLVIIASDPREFTILNVVGSIDLAQMAKLQQQLDLPDTGVEKVAESAL
jgi:hypothetical protein